MVPGCGAPGPAPRAPHAPASHYKVAGYKVAAGAMEGPRAGLGSRAISVQGCLRGGFCHRSTGPTPLRVTSCPPWEVVRVVRGTLCPVHCAVLTAWLLVFRKHRELSAQRMGSGPPRSWVCISGQQGWPWVDPLESLNLFVCTSRVAEGSNDDCDELCPCPK